MSGLEEARAKNEALKGEVRSETTPVLIEHHDTVVSVKHYSTIKGLEEVTTDIIPVPYYKLVQPGSTGIRLEDGQDAECGQFYMGDTGTAADNLRVGIVRAKRMVKVFKGKRTVSLGILGVNLETMTPFLMNISSTNFSNFGRMMNILNQRKIDAIWKFPVNLISGDDFKVETDKIIDGEKRKVKYWTMDFQVEEEGFNEEDLEIMMTVLNEYAGTLDKEQTDEDGMPF